MLGFGDALPGWPCLTPRDSQPRLSRAGAGPRGNRDTGKGLLGLFWAVLWSSQSLFPSSQLSYTFISFSGWKRQPFLSRTKPKGTPVACRRSLAGAASVAETHPSAPEAEPLEQSPLK